MVIDAFLVGLRVRWVEPQQSTHEKTQGRLFKVKHVHICKTISIVFVSIHVLLLSKQYTVDQLHQWEDGDPKEDSKPACQKKWIIKLKKSEKTWPCPPRSQPSSASDLDHILHQDLSASKTFGLTQAVTLAKEDIHMGNVPLQGIIGWILMSKISRKS